MPFSPPSATNPHGVAMWQLSFPIDLQEAKALAAKGAEALLAESSRRYVLPVAKKKKCYQTNFDQHCWLIHMTRCSFWHSPIPELIQATPAENVTGYPAFDRQPLEAREKRDFQVAGAAKPLGSYDGQPNEHVTLIGDAAHPMSPFKGQVLWSAECMNKKNM
jgi:salicylate hydroxylase